MRFTLFLSIFLTPLVAYADPMVYDNEADFLSNAAIETTQPFHDLAPTEGYETVLGQGPITIEKAVFDTDGEDYFTHEPASWTIFENAGIDDPNGRWGLNHGNIGTDTISFMSGGATNAIGFYLITGGYTYEDNFKIVVHLADGSEFLDVFTFGFQVDGTGAMYRGYLAEDALISSVTLANQESGPVWTSWRYDNVSYGAIESASVPEPSALALALIGISVAGLAYRKRRKA